MPIPKFEIAGVTGTQHVIDEDHPIPVAVVGGGGGGGIAPLDVHVTSFGITITRTPVVTAGVYVAGDNVGGMLTFADAAREPAGGGITKEVIIIDDASQSAALELWLFDRLFAAGLDNAAWTPVEADLENLVDIISTVDGTYYVAGATGTVCVIEVSRRFDLPAGGTSLFGRLVTRGTPTYVATDDVSVKIGLLQD